jgi:hypothetical protein
MNQMFEFIVDEFDFSCAVSRSAPSFDLPLRDRWWVRSADCVRALYAGQAVLIIELTVTSAASNFCTSVMRCAMT